MSEVIHVGPSTAIYVKTESGDDYLFSRSRSFTDQELCDTLKENLGDEFPYISTIIVDTSACNCPDTDLTFDAVYSAMDEL